MLVLENPSKEKDEGDSFFSERVFLTTINGPSYVIVDSEWCESI